MMNELLSAYIDRIRKILNLRIFDNDEGKRWDKSVMDKQYEILCVSQVGVFFGHIISLTCRHGSKYTAVKIGNFPVKKCDLFHTFIQNIH